MRIGEGLSLGEKLGDDCFDFLLAKAMAVDGLDEFAISVVGDDAVAFELGFFNFLGALAGSDENVLEFNLISLCLFEIIHDDLDFLKSKLFLVDLDYQFVIALDVV